MQGIETLILTGNINPHKQLNQIVRELNAGGRRVVNISSALNGPSNYDMKKIDVRDAAAVSAEWPGNAPFKLPGALAASMRMNGERGPTGPRSVCDAKPLRFILEAPCRISCKRHSPHPMARRSRGNSPQGKPYRPAYRHEAPRPY